jgi:ribosomal protein S13
MPGSLEPISTLLATGPIILNSDSEPESDEEVCSWTGGVNNHLEDNPEDWIDLSGMDSEPDDELEELEGDELRGSLETEISREAEVLQNSDTALYQKLMRLISFKEWKQAEKNRALGYNGQSARSKRRKRKDVRDKECRDEETQKSSAHNSLTLCSVVLLT